MRAAGAKRDRLIRAGGEDLLIKEKHYIDLLCQTERNSIYCRVQSMTTAYSVRLNTAMRLSPPTKDAQKKFDHDLSLACQTGFW